MSENNKTYRIRANAGAVGENFINVKLDQDYDTFQILSLTLKDSDTYRLHNANYGVIVGRVLANENFGVPNAKISLFISADTRNMTTLETVLYPYTSLSTRNEDGIIYNLLPNEKVNDCHQPVGTFPTKSYLLDNEDVIEIFDNYYKYTTRTNNAGDYMICGVPVGNHQIHMDLDLSDCGILSQRPRDFVYKGYTIEQFENPNMFKTGTTLSSLSQIFTQNQMVNVVPFWGNESDGSEIGVTRADIQISFTFQPTCVFMGSVVSDAASNGISQKCVPTNNMGAMDELTTGKGTIEIIRKTPGGNIEQIQVKGNEVINGNGVWCYQIPMNLDYMMTDEYGNMVPTDDPSKGIPTRTSVRFRLSLDDFGNNNDNYYLSKALIPNNPDISAYGDIDYNFGTETKDSSFRDLFWNNVYSVKSYIPRFQKSKAWRSDRFSGIKHCNIYGNNNPIPYNNIRVQLPLEFMIMCSFIKMFVRIVQATNQVFFWIAKKLGKLLARSIFLGTDATKEFILRFTYLTVGERLCSELDGWFFAPGANTKRTSWGADIIFASDKGNNGDDIYLLGETYKKLIKPKREEYVSDELDQGNTEEFPMLYHVTDKTSIDSQNDEDVANDNETTCLTTDIDYLLSCIEMELAQKYKVIQFDFYNDWINGLIYLPRWKRVVKTKRNFWFLSWPRKKIKVKGCMNAGGTGTAKSRYYTQKCALEYGGRDGVPYSEIKSNVGCGSGRKGRSGKNGGDIPIRTGANGETAYDKTILLAPEKCHKASGMKMSPIFGKKNGLVTEVKTMRNQYVYYLKPCEWGGTSNNGKRTLLFATDIILLGSLNDCDENGIPQAFKYLESSSYKMPTNLALTTMDDDAYIYTTTGATICGSKDIIGTSEMDSKLLGDKMDEMKLQRMNPTYGGTYLANSVKTYDEQISYENNDDPIAITEAAGIMWNYTGPGQALLTPDLKSKSEGGKILKNIVSLFSTGKIESAATASQEFLYYPGGHFLGLTCYNSQTNIKSCINLQRICEAGVSMSTRHEIVRGYDEEKDELKYRYLVPTGFIAQDEINDTAFRSMFSTMNMRKLIADDVDEKTGYPCYKFKYMRPNGFDGTFSAYAYKDNTPYNRSSVDVLDESETMTAIFGSNGWTKPDDYDDEESGYTETRTIEDVSKDYYMFRMGLNSLSVRDQMDRFLLSNGDDIGMLPQYENSFYFYFGLKDGATALDEFKSQFFSECDRRTLMTAANLRVKTTLYPTNLSGTITLIIEGMVPGYTINVVDAKNGGVAVALNGTKMENIMTNRDTYSFDVPYGVYDISVTDENEVTKTATVELGMSVVKNLNMRVVHYRVPVSESGNVMGKDGRLGGYVIIDAETEISGETYYTTATTGNRVMVGVINGDSFNEIRDKESYVDANGVGRVRLFGFTPNTDVKIGMRVITNSMMTQIIPLDTINLKTNEPIDLLCGCYALSYKNKLKNLGDNWWEDINGSNIEDWVLKQQIFRQTSTDNRSFDSHVIGYASNGEKVNTILFGYPEKSYYGGYMTMTSGYSEADSNRYGGYVLTDRSSHYPTWGIKDSGGVFYGDERGFFSKMVYTEDGRSAVNPLDVTISSIVSTELSDGTYGNKVTFSGNGLKRDTGAIIVFENGEIVFPFMTSDNDGIYYGDSPDSINANWLKMAAVYPTFTFPVMYRPFFASVKFLTTAYAIVNNPNVSAEYTSPTLSFIYKPYFVGGEIHNGNTFGDRLSTNVKDTMICGYGLNGNYPTDPFYPESNGVQYQAVPLGAYNLTRTDVLTAGTENLITATDTYTSGRTLMIVGEKYAQDYVYPGFPYYNHCYTGNSFSYTFTQGYPQEIVTEAETTYSAYTQPYFPSIFSCSDSVTPQFVDYIIFETNGTEEDLVTKRLLYGNVESTEYEGTNGYLRYYDVTGYGLKNDYYAQSGDGVSNINISNGAWVYSNDDTGQRQKPTATVACFSNDANYANLAGSNITYVKVYYDKTNNTVYADVPKYEDGALKYNKKIIMPNPGTIDGDIIYCLKRENNGKGINELYRILTEECSLVPMKNPSPMQNGDSSQLPFSDIIGRTYDAFISANNGGRQVSLSNTYEFNGSYPEEVLGVCKHVNGKNETYVFKYFIETYNFGSKAVSSDAMGGENVNIGTGTDMGTIPTTGSSFHVTITSDVEWILVITSTTRNNAVISCDNIGEAEINASWYFMPEEGQPDLRMTKDKIREIQKVGTDDANVTHWDNWSDGAGHQGYHFPPGTYVFEVSLKENRTGEDILFDFTSIPYYYTDDDSVQPSTTVITQKTRKIVEFAGSITTRYRMEDGPITLYKDYDGTEEFGSGYVRVAVDIDYNFNCVSDFWPGELSVVIDMENLTRVATFKEYHEKNTTEIPSSTTVTYGIPNQKQTFFNQININSARYNGTTAGFDATNTANWIIFASGTPVSYVNISGATAETKIDIYNMTQSDETSHETLVISSGKTSGTIHCLYKIGDVENLKEIYSIVTGSSQTTIRGITFTNLADRYVGKLNTLDIKKQENVGGMGPIETIEQIEITMPDETND